MHDPNSDGGATVRVPNVLAMITLALAAASLHAAGVVTETIAPLGTSPAYVITFAWTGDSSTGAVPITAATGTCDGEILVCSAKQGPVSLAGMVVLTVETAPGSPAPTNGYGVKILDASGADQLGGAAVAVSSTAFQGWASAATAAPLTAAGISLSISGQSVHSAQGKVYVFVIPLQLAGTLGTRGTGGGGGGGGAAVWGSITGTLSSQADLEAALSALQPALGYVPENVANKDAANGYAGLTASAMLKLAQIPILNQNTSGNAATATTAANVFPVPIPPNCTSLGSGISFTTTFAAGIPCNALSLSGPGSSIALPFFPAFSQAELWITYTGSPTTTPIGLAWTCGSSNCSALPSSPDVTSTGAVTLVELRYNLQSNSWGGFIAAQTNGAIALGGVPCSQGAAGPPIACGSGNTFPGNAASATNVAGGLANQVAYQTGPGATAFAPVDTNTGHAFCGGNPPQFGTSCASAGIAPFFYYTGTGSPATMTGSDVVISPSVALPALAASGCYRIDAYALTSVSGAVGTFKLKVGSITIATPYANTDHVRFSVLYCNQNGSQTAQDVAYMPPGIQYANDSFLDSNVDAVIHSPTAVTFSSGQTLTFTVSALSGTATLQYLHVVQQ